MSVRHCNIYDLTFVNILLWKQWIVFCPGLHYPVMTLYIILVFAVQKINRPSWSKKYCHNKWVSWVSSDFVSLISGAFPANLWLVLNWNLDSLFDHSLASSRRGWHDTMLWGHCCRVEFIHLILSVHHIHVGKLKFGALTGSMSWIIEIHFWLFHVAIVGVWH